MIQISSESSTVNLRLCQQSNSGVQIYEVHYTQQDIQSDMSYQARHAS